MALSEKEKRMRARTLYEIAKHLYDQGEAEEALNYFRKSLKLHPSVEGHIGLADIYDDMGLMEEAIEECKKAIQIDTSNYRPYEKIAHLYFEINDYHTAEQWLSQGIEKVANEFSKASLYYMLGRVYERRGQWHQALAAYEQSFDKNPKFFIALVAALRLRAKFN